MTLFEAVETGDVSQVKAALATTTDINQLGPEKRTPLIEAAGRGLLEVVQVLLAAGAEPEWRDESDETALLKASANGHLAVAKALVGTASEDDRGLANSFLQAFGASHGPEFQYDGSNLKRKAVEVAARAANFFGDEDPLARLDRQARGEAHAKKKR